MTDQTKECAEYFQSVPGFRRVMEQLLARYQRNGHAAGTIRLINASEQERDALCGLFGHPFSGEVTFKVRDFQAALQSSRFEGVDLKEVLEAYFHTSIQTESARTKRNNNSSSCWNPHIKLPEATPVNSGWGNWKPNAGIGAIHF